MSFRKIYWKNTKNGRQVKGIKANFEVEWICIGLVWCFVAKFGGNSKRKKSKEIGKCIREMVNSAAQKMLVSNLYGRRTDTKYKKKIRNIFFLFNILIEK